MSATRYRVGSVVGAVQGNGGLLEGSAGLKRLRDAARGGRPSFYEPSPGHVRMYPWFTAEGNGRPVDVPYAGMRITIFRIRAALKHGS